jgi:hypothetical protein
MALLTQAVEYGSKTFTVLLALFETWFETAKSS